MVNSIDTDTVVAAEVPRATPAAIATTTSIPRFLDEQKNGDAMRMIVNATCSVVDGCVGQCNADRASASSKQAFKASMMSADDQAKPASLALAMSWPRYQKIDGKKEEEEDKMIETKVIKIYIK